jgi:hypothetical protein
MGVIRTPIGAVPLLHASVFRRSHPIRAVLVRLWCVDLKPEEGRSLLDGGQGSHQSQAFGEEFHSSFVVLQPESSRDVVPPGALAQSPRSRASPSRLLPRSYSCQGVGLPFRDGCYNALSCAGATLAFSTRILNSGKGRCAGSPLTFAVGRIEGQTASHGQVNFRVSWR